MRAQDERRRRRHELFHVALNARLVAEGIPELPPQSFGQLRIDIERYAMLRTELAIERWRRRDLLRLAKEQQRESGCAQHAVPEAA